MNQFKKFNSMIFSIFTVVFPLALIFTMRHLPPKEIFQPLLSSSRTLPGICRQLPSYLSPLIHLMCKGHANGMTKYRELCNWLWKNKTCLRSFCAGTWISPYSISEYYLLNRFIYLIYPSTQWWAFGLFPNMAAIHKLERNISICISLLMDICFCFSWKNN